MGATASRHTASRPEKQAAGPAAASPAGTAPSRRQGSAPGGDKRSDAGSVEDFRSSPAKTQNPHVQVDVPREKQSEPEQPTTPSSSPVVPKSRDQGGWSRSTDSTVCRSGSAQGALSGESIEQPVDASLEPILGLAASVFQSKTIILWLLDGDRTLVHGGDAKEYPPGLRARLREVLEPPNLDIVIVHDTENDRRTCVLPGVASHIRFAAVVRLYSVDNYRLGTLCVCAGEARKWRASEDVMLRNMADVVSREVVSGIERVQERALQVMSRVVDRVAAPQLLVQVGRDPANTRPPWRILQVNLAAAREIGLTRDDCVDKDFWDIFSKMRGGVLLEKPWTFLADRVAAGLGFDIANVSLKVNGGPPGPGVAMSFRLADPTLLLAAGPPSPASSGGPPALPPAHALHAGGRQHFVVDVDAGPRRLIERCSVDGLPEKLPFQGLVLGPVLGKGGYGCVYQGVYQGSLVAVKVCDAGVVRRDPYGVPMEAVVTAGMAHPHVVRTYAHAAMPGPPRQMRHGIGPAPGEPRVVAAARAAAAAPPEPDHEQVWLLLEYCDRGCLLDAIKTPWFRHKCAGGASQPNFATMLATAKEIAAGMAFLHARDIIHGDLTGSNILLKSSATNPHGFTAKVADFGLARDMKPGISKLETKTIGAITHMAPEVLSYGHVSKGADVYAFGVLLWEMCCGKRAWEGCSAPQVMLAVVLHKQLLAFPDDAPSGYVELAQQCMAPDARARPTFVQIVWRLGHTCGGRPQRAGRQSSGGGSGAGGSGGDGGEVAQRANSLPETGLPDLLFGAASDELLAPGTARPPRAPRAKRPH